MKKTNVLHIITKLELGGAQQNTLFTVKNLNKKKYNVFLLSGDSGILTEDARSIKDAGIILVPYLKHEIAPLNDLICFFKLVKLFKKLKLDIVHTHSSKAGILGRFAAYFAGVPLIIHTIHGFSFNDFQDPLTRKIYIFLERIAAAITDKLVAVTKIDIDKGLKACIGKPAQYTVIHSGINIRAFAKKYDKKSIRKEFKIPGDYKVVGMAACFKPQKNPLDFVRAAKIVVKSFSKARFIILGDGVLRPDLEKLIKKLRLEKNIILAGWRRDVPRILSVFDVLVLTSLWEGLPRVFPQAMAAKKPIVATLVDGAKEAIVDGKNGFVCAPFNTKEIAGKIIYLLKNGKIAEKMGRAGYGMVKPYGEDYMVKQIEELYDELIRKEKI